VRRALAVSGAAVALSLAPAASLGAQHVSFLLSGVHSRYADSLEGSAARVGARMRLQTPTLWTGLEAGLAQFTTGEWAGQAQFGSVGLCQLAPDLGVGLRVQADVNYLEGGLWSALTTAGPFVTAGVARWQLSLAASGGVVRRVDGTSSPLGTTWLRVRHRLDRWNLDASVSGTAAQSARFLDATAGIGIEAARLSGGALVGVRTGDLSDDPWIQGHLELRVAGPLTVEIAAGTYPLDVTGFTSGFFATGGLRIAAVGVPRFPAGPPSIQIERAGPARVRITFTVPGADRVALAGEWNAWTPEPLEPVGDGRWSGELTLPPGVYRFSLIVNGDRWMVPDGVATVPDGFGGEAGVLVVR
jgi:hypothetical protein